MYSQYSTELRMDIQWWNSMWDSIVGETIMSKKTLHCILLTSKGTNLRSTWSFHFCWSWLREDFMLNMILRFLVRHEGKRKDKKGKKGKGGRIVFPSYSKWQNSWILLPTIWMALPEPEDKILRIYSCGNMYGSAL